MSDQSNPESTNPGPLAAPGPHVHEAADAKTHGGSNPEMPEGVEPFDAGNGDEGDQAQ